MALSCKPSLLIADEPTTALDVTTQAQILELMRELQHEFGMAILFITHNLGVVAEMADDVVVMYLGKVVEQAPVEEIFDDPKHPVHAGAAALDPEAGQEVRASGWSRSRGWCRIRSRSRPAARSTRAARFYQPGVCDEPAVRAGRAATHWACAAIGTQRSSTDGAPDDRDAQPRCAPTAPRRSDGAILLRRSSDLEEVSSRSRRASSSKVVGAGQGGGRRQLHDPRGARRWAWSARAAAARRRPAG